MSRPSFRPRPIDLTKPLPIIKTSKDLRNEDDVVVSRALPAVATGVDPAEEEERHLQEALLASVFGADRPAPADIPVPIVAAVQPPRIPPPPFVRPPAAYIMFDRSDHDLEDALVEYDADHVDAAFVRRLAVPALSMDVLERAMDALEKAQGRRQAVRDPDVAPDAPLPLMPYAAARALLADVAPALPESARRDLHAHWHARRLDTRAPFLRLYQPPPEAKNSDPAVAFRPRERDPAAGAARRTNTYDNFRRATILREELCVLRDVLASVVDREQSKKALLAVQILMHRLHAVAEGGARMEAVFRAIFSGEQEPVVLYGPPAMQVMVPCRDLALPPEIHVVHRRLVGAGGDKAAKKTRKKALAKAAAGEKGRGGGGVGIGAGRDALVAGPGGAGGAGVSGAGAGAGSGANSRLSPGGSPTSVDTFGYDDHGNKFLKHMRYFAGGFMNYGVSPYDHRVFSAASERNTVRVLPRHPDPVTFPGPRLKFGSLRDTNRVHCGAKLGPGKLTTADVRADILGDKRAAGPFAPSVAAAAATARGVQKSFRTRARVGRGGRIVLDRVVFERERGVKAASYPASVAMGGVYTAGLPLDAAREVARKVPSGGGGGGGGALGNVLDLGGLGGLGEDAGNADGADGAGGADDGVDSAEEGLVQLSRKLIPSLEPMVKFAAGGGGGPEVVNFWPRRRKGGRRARGGKAGFRGGRRVEMWGGREGEQRRNLLTYAPRERPLVVDMS